MKTAELQYLADLQVAPFIPQTQGWPLVAFHMVTGFASCRRSEITFIPVDGFTLSG
jgi:hypothetical protein